MLLPLPHGGRERSELELSGEDVSLGSHRAALSRGEHVKDRRNSDHLLRLTDIDLLGCSLSCMSRHLLPMFTTGIILSELSWLRFVEHQGLLSACRIGV